MYIFLNREGDSWAALSFYDVESNSLGDMLRPTELPTSGRNKSPRELRSGVDIGWPFFAPRCFTVFRFLTFPLKTRLLTCCPKREICPQCCQSCIVAPSWPGKSSHIGWLSIGDKEVLDSFDEPL